MSIPNDLINRLENELAEDEKLFNALIEKVESLDSLLSPLAKDVVEDLRPITVTDNVYEEIDEDETIGERIADNVAQLAGSWRFIIGFMIFMIIWVVTNTMILSQSFDPYPFILLNLGLSSLAELQAPVILMSQNRQASKDRAVAENDYQVNLKSELEIADLHRKLDKLILTIDTQSKLINSLIVLRQQDAKLLTSVSIVKIRDIDSPIISNVCTIGGRCRVGAY